MEQRTQHPLESIIGEQLSAVVFVRDYVQFQFDGPTLSCITWPTLITGSSEIRHEDLRYRNELCKRIGSSVRGAEVRERVDITVTFDDDTSLVTSLKPEDYAGPEAAVFQGSGKTWVW